MNKIKLIILAVIVTGLLMHCTTGQRVTTAYASQPSIDQPTSDMLTSGSDESLFEAETIERKVLYSAYLSLSVEVPDTANIYIERIAKKYKGYVQEIGTSRTEIRVKSENLKDAVEEISALGKVKVKNMTGQDVTEDYYDAQIRLENAEKSRNRYLELLAKAESVEATLKVEKELERLNGTIDLLKGKMSRIEHLSEFSTITISLKERKKPGFLGYIGLGLYKSVKWMFVRN